MGKKNWVDGPKIPLQYAFLDTFALPISRFKILFVGVASTNTDNFIANGKEIYVRDFPILKDKVLLYNFATKKWIEKASIPLTGNFWINKISCSMFFTKGYGPRFVKMKVNFQSNYLSNKYHSRRLFCLFNLYDIGGHYSQLWISSNKFLSTWKKVDHVQNSLPGN